MDHVNNKGEVVGSLTVAISNDKSITISRTPDVTIVSTRDRNTEGFEGNIYGRFAIWQLGVRTRHTQMSQRQQFLRSASNVRRKRHAVIALRRSVTLTCFRRCPLA
jgi:hypothetical protein